MEREGERERERRMDVTQGNLGEALALFRELVPQCQVAAIDLEMTGLYSGQQQQPSYFDSWQTKYSHARASAQDQVRVRRLLLNLACDSALRAD